MTSIDWVVLVATMVGMFIYGMYQHKKVINFSSFHRPKKQDSWLTIGLSVMATQASAITFLSTPGQGFASGMGFVQFYFGLPLAMIIICIFFIPRFINNEVYTAYEILEKRLGLKNRLLTALIFLIQRGASASITILAPSLILSLILQWNLNITILVIGAIVTAYTVSGGSPAVNYTNKIQMTIMLFGLLLTFILVLWNLPQHINFSKALDIASLADKLEVIGFDFDVSNKYTIWSGLTGGLFLALAYFGTDQSQVQRYISAKNIKQSQVGLLFNAIFKIPMQFFILLIGVLVFVFYQYKYTPLNFNPELVTMAKTNPQYQNQWMEHEAALKEIQKQKIMVLNQENIADNQQQIKQLMHQEEQLRTDAKALLDTIQPGVKTVDSDYVFLTFILNYMPHGIIGLMIAVIFFASMSSASSEINALGTCSMMDFYKRISKKKINDKTNLRYARLFNLFWGIITLLFAYFFSQAENLIEGVNILGSLFYGNILGVFLITFFITKINGTAVFISMIITQILILSLYFFEVPIGFLWYNFIACLTVMLLSYLLSGILGIKHKSVNS